MYIIVPNSPIFLRAAVHVYLGIFQPHSCYFASILYLQYWHPKSRMGSQDTDGERKEERE